MAAAPKIPPRFLPTLTEVVSSPLGAVSAPAPGPGRPGPETEELIERVMQRLDLSLQSRLREMIAVRVQEQMHALELGLRQDIASALRPSVAEAVAQELAALPRG